jgi:diketogulonate reductase-like aldo/keto reductase
MFEGSFGLQLNGQSFTVLMSGKTSASALTAVVFPEPFEPLIRTPPILGFTAFKISASLSSSSDTIAEKGKVVASDILSPPFLVFVHLMNLSKADNFPKSIYVIIFVFFRFLLDGSDEMEYREFGWTGTKVSSIGMGTYYDASYIVTSLLFHHQMGRDEKVAALKRGLDLGINLIDTAEVYQSEDIVAEAIDGHDRDNLFVATKIFWTHLRYKSVLKAAEKSLRKLKCSYIDLYQIHFPNSMVPIGETMKAMEKLVEDGKVRYLGLSNFSLEQMKKAEEALSKNKIASNQVEYNLKARGIEKDLLSYCEQKSIVILPYRPIAHGSLADPQGKLKIAMGTISRKHNGKTPARLALNWLMTKNKLIFPIPRASRPERVIENVGSVGWSLDGEDIGKPEEAAAS